MKEFKRTVFEFKIDGQIYSIRKPTVKDIQEFQKISKKSSEDENLDVAVEFLSKLGLEKEISYGLEGEHLTSIIEWISGQNEKKS